MLNKNLLRNKWGIASAAVLCGILWGSAIPVLKISYMLLGVNHPLQMILLAGYRFLIAGAVLLAVVRIFLKSPIIPKRNEWLVIIVVALCQTCAGGSLYYISISNTAAAKVAIMTGTEVFITMVLSSLAFKDDKMSARKIIGLLLGMAGIIISNYNVNELDFSFRWEGEGLVILCALFFSIALIVVKKRSKEIHIVRVNAWQSLIGGSILLVLGLSFGRMDFSFGWDSTGLLVYLVAVSAIAVTLWFTITKSARTGDLAIYKFLMPVFGAVFSFIFLPDEPFTWIMVIGLALVAGGIVIVNYRRPNKQL